MPKTTQASATQENLPAKNQLQRYSKIRDFTDRIVEPLTAEDCMVQSMDDVSPTRWHIAHTTWFFETFVLKATDGYSEFNPQFNYLFNSYYNSIGEQFPRPQRGFISRPGLDQIKEYRHHVDQHMARMIESGISVDIAKIIEVGLQHEQQHQELMLTDIKHVLSCNPTLPKYTDTPFDFVTPDNGEASWTEHSGGRHSVGFHGEGFSFDNESPRHQVYLEPFQLADRLVTNRQYIEFIEHGGYQKPEYWLSMGWSTANSQRWNAPMYWVNKGDEWHQFTLSGLQPVNLDWPVCHVSYFEADAFARWSGNRLPTEFEWEVTSQSASKSNMVTRNEPFADCLLDNNLTIHPTRSPSGLLGGLWQWTSSSYGAYPGYRPAPGAIGEYNGKFMCNQYVLRGGSVATSRNHIRPTYRNFFPPESRWQFFGIRLAR